MCNYCPEYEEPRYSAHDARADAEEEREERAEFDGVNADYPEWEKTFVLEVGRA